MKMNINKACDLKSISVFPPNFRIRGGSISRLATDYVFPFRRRSSVEPLPSQLRSQQSQQSFSQGPSSQRGGFSHSQMTQSSVDELLLNDQRFSSQERDLSLKKNSFLPPINHKRDDSQMAASRSSSALTRRWTSASAGESRSQIGEELEQRFGMMESSLTKFGMMLDSLQSDIMQANRGTKEVFLETERINQKLILQDTSLQQLIKEQAVVKTSLDGAVKSILEELIKDPNQEKLQRIYLMLTAIPEQVETSLQKIQKEICLTLTRESQVLASLKMPEPIVQVQASSQAKAKESLIVQRDPEAKFRSNGICNTTLKPKQQQLPRKASARSVKTSLSPKAQVGCWKTVKPEQSKLKKSTARKQVKPEGTRTQLEQCSVVIDSDEDIDGGFSCLLNGNTKGTNFEWDAEKETERLLRTARRTKRKFGNPIIIN